MFLMIVESASSSYWSALEYPVNRWHNVVSFRYWLPKAGSFLIQQTTALLPNSAVSLALLTR